MTTQENIVLLVSRNKNLAPRYLRNVSRLVILSGPKINKLNYANEKSINTQDIKNKQLIS